MNQRVGDLRNLRRHQESLPVTTLMINQCLKTSNITIKHIRVLHKKMKGGEVAYTDRNS